MRLALLLLFGMLPGCSLEAINADTTERTTNQCESDAECGAGGTCETGRCIADEGRLTSVLVEVNVPADAPEISGVRFLKRLTELPAGGGVLDIELGHIARVSGRVSAQLADFQVKRGCKLGFVDSSGEPVNAPASDGSIPARLAFTPVERFLGLSAASSNAEAQALDDGFDFDVKLAPGEYHLYVEPPPTSDPACAPVPQIYRQQAIEAGDVSLPVKLPPPQQLKLTIRWPEVDCSRGGCRTLDGWVVDMIDPKSGRVISSRPTLLDDQSAIIEGKRQYQVELLWSPAIGSSGAEGAELIRLLPPDSVVAPRILLERSVLELFAGEGLIDKFETLPSVIDVEGQVVVAESAEPVSATVTLIATELAGIERGLFTSYVRVVEADENGNFNVELLPGQYLVQAAPPIQSGLGAAETNWAIAETPNRQAGKVIELQGGVPVVGTVLTPGAAEAVAGASVHLEPAGLGPAATSLEKVLGIAPLTPRSISGTTGERGDFQLLSDPGTFDFSIRPAPGAGFAWLVRPNINVSADPAVGSGTKELGEMTLPLPVLYRGKVKAPATGEVPGALVRVFVYQDESGSYVAGPADASAVLQIAETQVSPDGEYSLNLPARL